ncbi:hypothetical protein H5T58_01975, partial [Candidatus Parcubacteria bacterium]|nr:hypothetical protein [Candidatus Parcubacteria bacterium]
MRLLIKLKALNNISCGKQHFIPIQGFIYSLLKDTSFNHIHQEKNYKFFCFSNLFSQKGNSFNHFKKGKIYNLIISSPNEIFLKTIGKEILTQEKIKIGSAFFKLKTLTFFQPKLSTPLKIATQSPIIIRIP